MKANIFCIVLFAMQCTYAQKTVYFPGFELINMDRQTELEYSISKLLKSYIEDNHDFTILLDERIGEPTYDTRQSIAYSAKEAQKRKARYLMKGEIHFLQGTYILSLGVYEALTLDQVWHDLVKGAAEQDLDPLLSRLGRSFFTSKTAKTDIYIDEVTEYDQQGIELAQIKVNHFFGVMLGGKQIFDETTLSGFGLGYTYDASNFLFNLDFELFPTSTLFFDDDAKDRKLQNGNVNLGVTYPFSKRRNTLFINGGMEYGFTRLRDKVFEEEYILTRGGIGAYFGGGFLINRNSTVNLRLFGAVSVPFYEVDETNLTGVKFGIVTSFAR